MGEGTTADEAKSRAQADITEQIELRIEAHTRIQETGNVRDSTLLVEAEIAATANSALTGAEPVHREKKGSRYYALCRYDIRPLRIKVTATIEADQLTLKNRTESETPTAFGNHCHFSASCMTQEAETFG